MKKNIFSFIVLLFVSFTVNVFCDEAKLEKFGRLIGPCKVQTADFERIKQLILSVDEPTSYSRPKGVTNRDVSFAAIYFAWDESDLLKKQIAEIPKVDIAGLKKQIDLLDQAISKAVEDITKNQATQADRVIEVLSAISKRIEGNTDILKLQSECIVGILDGVEEQLKALQKISDQLDRIENGVKQSNNKLDGYNTNFNRIEKSQDEIKNILEAMRLAEEAEDNKTYPDCVAVLFGVFFRAGEQGERSQPREPSGELNIRKKLGSLPLYPNISLGGLPGYIVGALDLKIDFGSHSVFMGGGTSCLPTEEKEFHSFFEAGYRYGYVGFLIRVYPFEEKSKRAVEFLFRGELF
ncbi:MAG: hypothetical protein NTV62_04355 [Candidatus Gribaldobacteria bacterium]|nr:hypothetical protein [Candidatus Gribaldobacteria bacterium]